MRWCKTAARTPGDSAPRPWSRRGWVAAHAAAFAAAIAAAAPAIALAQGATTLPKTTIAPSEGGAPPASSGASTPIAAKSPAPAAAHHAASVSHHAKPASYSAPTVEPASAMLKLRKDSWAYARPTTSAPPVEQVHSGKFVKVTGTTRSYVQVKLKSGTTAYVPVSAVEMTRPADKVFQLTHDASVMSEPNRWGHKLAEVHRGHSVHVVGIALNYVKIKMKDGVEGYIPQTSLE
jgi:hypothetical protein